MERTELRFEWVSDESCNIYLNDELIFHMNHDNIDWLSMGDIENAFRAVANKAGWDISTIVESDEAN